MLLKIREQKGIILMMSILMLTFLLVLMGIVGDFMRMFVVKRELQDALDAAVISAAQIDSDKKQSQYVYEVWGTCCDAYGCWCCHPQPVSLTHKTIDNPDGLVSGYCDQTYRGEYNRWIDYNVGQSPQALATDVFNQNIAASLLIQRGQSNGYIQSATPAFYINNVQGTPLYPSISGEVQITIKPYILNKIIGVSTIPIICRSQANTDYEVYKNGIYEGLSPVPAPQWSGGGIIGGGQRSRPN